MLFLVLYLIFIFLLLRFMWMMICFNTDKNFCDEQYTIEYDGYVIKIIRGEHDQGHELFIETTQDKYEDAHEAGRRFLSEICWLYKTQAEVLTYGGGGNRTKFLVQAREFFRIGNALSLEDYEQILFDEEHKLALSIYKEGFNSNSNLYSFLCFARIINMVGNGKQQIKWVNSNIGLIKNQSEVTKYFNSISVTDIGEHLYVSGRCAIAHADVNSTGPIVNADSFKDNDRIFRELGFIRELSEIYIKNELGVKDEGILFNERLLRGFKKILGEEFLGLVSSNQEEVDESKYPEIPKISLSIKNPRNPIDQLGIFEMTINKASNGKVILDNSSQDFPMQITITVDLLNESIEFDILESTIDENHDSFTDIFHLKYLKFQKECLLNGRVEIVNSDTGECISVLIPYIPCNIRINWDFFDKAIDTLEKSI